MKLRIKGNSLRIRLTKKEVSELAATGYLEEQTNFAGNKFVYALQAADAIDALSAQLGDNKITMIVPVGWAKEWPGNDLVGFDSKMPVNESTSLYLLLEKDFVCLDDTTEDQSDHYENPNKTC
jgi:hypothetical protein